MNLFACQKPFQERMNSVANNQNSDFFISANQHILKNEELKIDSLINEAGILFLTHSSGIRLYLEKDDSEKDILLFPVEGNTVKLEYNCIVFNHSNSLYDDFIMDTLSFKIGHSKQMKGLNYAIKLLQIGDKAKIVIPSYLGFGMSGYGKSVPPYSTLLLNVKLLNIEQ